MHHLLLRNQMRRLHNQLQQRIDARAPLVQNAVGILGSDKRDDAGGTVDFGVDGLFDY